MHRVESPSQIACNSLTKSNIPSELRGDHPQCQARVRTEASRLIVNVKSTNEMNPDFLDVPKMRRMLIICLVQLIKV